MKTIRASFYALVVLFLCTNTLSSQDRTMLQGFYWDVTPGGVWYDSLTHYAPFLGEMGVSSVWFPPPSKGRAGGMDVGYTPYDYYDLGEFNSSGGEITSENGSLIPTRYGTRQQLETAIQTLKTFGIESYVDAVLNHRSGGVLEPNAYSQWYVNEGGSLVGKNDSTYTAFPLKYGSGRIAWDVGEGNEYFFPNAAHNPDNTGDFYADNQFGYFSFYTNGFAYDVAIHDGNGDNLPMGDSLTVWSNWLVDEIGFDGFRLDFVKGIHPEFLRRWASQGSVQGKFVVGELFDGSLDRLNDWLNRHSGLEQDFAIFDFNLRFAYKEWSDQGENYDIKNLHSRGMIHNGTPWHKVVHFVDSHDFDRNDYQGNATQEGHAPIIGDKALIYAHMMALPGKATLFYRDLFWYGLRDDLALLTKVRSRFMSGGYEILTARGDTFWPGNADGDSRQVTVLQRTGDNVSTGAIMAINKSSSLGIDVWVTAADKWKETKLIDITGNRKDTLEVFADGRVQIRTNPKSYHVYVPLGTELGFSDDVELTEYGAFRDDYLVGDQISSTIGIKSESFFGKDSIAIAFRLEKPSSDVVTVLDTIATLKAYDELRFNLPTFDLDEVGEYTLSTWLTDLASDTLKISINAADTVGAPVFRLDGLFSENEYKKLIERTSVETGFGPDKVLDAVYYGFDSDTLYFGLEGEFVLGEGDGIGFVIDFNELTGIPAGTPIGKNDGGTGYLDPAEAENAESSFDFEVDYGMSLLSAGSNSIDLSLVDFTLETPEGFIMDAVGADGLDVGIGPTTQTSISENGIRYAVDFTDGEAKGIEIALSASSLGIQNVSDLQFRFFGFVISGTAYFSNVMIPGEWADEADGFGNPGFNINFSEASDGPFHTNYYDINGTEIMGSNTENAIQIADAFKLHPVYPNPFNPSTNATYEISNSGRVRLSIMNILGQEVKLVVDKNQNSGNYSVNINASDLASGVYFLRLATEQGIQVQKMTLIK